MTLHNISIQFDWLDFGGQEGTENVFIQIPDQLTNEEIEVVLGTVAKGHAIDRGYGLQDQTWLWVNCETELPGGCSFMPLSLYRLRELAQTVATPKYKIGQIVEIKPDDRDEFQPGTCGLIVAVNAYNDDDDGPYTAYTVQIQDDPPNENNDFFDGFVFEGSWVVSVYERQVVRVLK